MNSLNLFTEMLTRYIEVLEHYNLVRNLNKYRFNKYPNLEVNLEDENKKIESSNLVIMLDPSCADIRLYPKHFAKHKKDFTISKEDYAKSSYKLMDTYSFLFSDSVSLKGELTYYTIEKKYEKFDYLVSEYNNSNIETLLEEMEANFDRLETEFKEDYEALSNAKEIYDTYTVLFNSPKPTGEYKELLKLLKDNNVPAENLTRLEKVDGNVVKFAKIKLNVGLIDYTKRNGFEYAFSGSMYYDDSFLGKPTELSNDLEYQINYLTEAKADADLAKKVIDVLNKIKNVNYYIK